MTRSKAIREKCRECAGETAKEVTLCHIFNCTLWPFRFGNSLKSTSFIKRMNLGKERHPKEFAEIKSILLKEGMDYYNNIQNKGIQAYVAQFYGIK